VLASPIEPPFEPICEATRFEAGLKLTMLLALASGDRRTELHALDLDEMFIVDNGNALFLKPSPDLIAKSCNTEADKGLFPGCKILKLGPILKEDS
jgi:hypothetical protein